ncbi:hypothetical protein EOD39_6844 [Acipenser ruthenus]|uniref:Uncharacterized protein n=1 Tax=Acipenser ruthenus TaxID=7906 RepID=A0A444U8W3_ACIRT|nr:hypothetical protein EOD39_6844 [Acipenser ruthenus]
MPRCPRCFAALGAFSTRALDAHCPQSYTTHGASELGLAEFPPVDLTIMALVQTTLVGGLPKDPTCPNGQCKVTETHLKKAYAAEAQAGLLTAYLDGILQSAPLCELVASELCLVSITVLQIFGFQGQALGRSLCIVVAHRQLWLSQGRVSDEDKSALLNEPISPGRL